MRIFYAVPGTAHQTRLADSRLWHVNLYMPLSDLGHELVSFDFDYTPFTLHLDPALPAHAEFIRRNRPRFGEALLKQVRTAHSKRPVDVFFSYFYSAYVEPEVIREIGRLGIVTVNWYCNASYQFRLVEEIAPAYHYCLVPEKSRMEDYRRIGAKPIYCQEAANPNVYRRFELPFDYDVAFVGQKYGDRPWYIRKLIDARVDARVWGPHWQETAEAPAWRLATRRLARLIRGRAPRVAQVPAAHCGPPLSDDDYIRMYSRSRISLGFSNVDELPLWRRPLRQVRLRDFEAPMSGAFYLVEYFAELAEFFEPDKEIVCFEGPKELIDKAKYYLSHERERERIRDAGMRRARGEHTWHQRFEAVFRAMGVH